MGVKPRRMWPPASRALAVFLLLNSVVLNLSVRQCTHQPTSLSYTRMFLTPEVHVWDDSWRPMQAALQYLEEHRDESVYEEVFFRHHVKFQYPPMSLLPLKVLNALQVGVDARTLNTWSRPAVVAIALVLALIFRMRLSLARGDALADGLPALALYGALALGFTLTFYPVVLAFELGQIQTWITLLFACAALAWISGQTMVAGVLCGLIACVKPQWALLLPWAFVRRRWRFAGGLAVTAGLVTLASIAIFGLASHLDYFRVLRAMAEHGESFYANQSINGLLQRLIHGGGEWRTNAFPEYNRWVYAGTMASSLVIVAFAIFFRFREHAHERTADFSIAVLSFTMASPIAWEHHYGVMLILFALAVPVVMRGDGSARKPLLVPLAAAYVLSSNYFDVAGRWSAAPSNLVQSYVLFGAAIMVVSLYRLRQSAALSSR